MPDPPGGSLAGSLLVAGPTMLDPNFFRSVVLVAVHDSDGAVGLVLNRPTDIPVEEHLPQWVPVVCDPSVVFVGGPVQPETAVGLGTLQGDPTEGWTGISGSLGLVDLATTELLDRIERLRVFSGYAGWGEGQLDFEVASSDWVVAPASDEVALGVSQSELWASVLRSLGGTASWYADFPADPSLN